MVSLVFEAQVRSYKGKAQSGRSRRSGNVPAVLYGQGKEPLVLELTEKEASSLIARTFGQNALLTMKLKDEAGAVTEKTVMIKEVQRDPAKSTLVHVDFYHVDMAHTVKLKIPVVLEGVPVGVKEGAILEHGVRTLNVRCLPSAIPACIKVDVSKLEANESIRLQDLPRVEGVDFLDAPQAVLAHVAEVAEEAAPVVVAAVPGVEGAVPAQPEVIGEKEREAKRAEKEGAKPEEGKEGAKAAPAAKGAPAPKGPAKK